MIRNRQYQNMLVGLPTYYAEPVEQCLQWVLQFNFQTTYTMAYAGEGHIDWGNGDSENLPKKTSFTNVSKSYQAGTYTVKITGEIEDIQAGMDINSKNAVVALEQFNLNSYIGNRATSFTLGVFFMCKNMVLMPGVVLGKNIKSLDGTFSGCSSLTTAPTIPDGVTDLNSTFSGCSSLTTAPTIPDGVIALNSTFYGCSSLTTAPTIPDGVIALNSTFYGCSSLTTAPTIPDGVIALNSTFYGCTGLVNIDGIWPANGFTKTRIDVDQMFYRGSVVAGKPTGTLPAEILWEAPEGKFSRTTQAFRNCTSLSNYDDIPANWK
jgi:hypothetical protein